jgi:gluconate kinase
MVIVLVAPPHTGQAALGRALAAELGWPYIEADHLRPIAARAVDRREHIVVGSSGVSNAEREALHTDLRSIRFVDVDDTPVAEAICNIRREFGV